MLKIGTLADWFGVGLLEGIRASERCGAEGVQIYAADEMAPDTMTAEKLRKVQRTVRDCRQQVTALCGELGGYGLERAADNAAKLDYLRKVIDLGCELDCHVVTTHIGVIPSDKSVPRYEVMRQACMEIGEYAAGQGSVIAIETGPEALPTLAAFVDDCGKGVGVNYDPANIVMVTGVDHVEGVKIAGKRIVHTHAKDGRNLQPVVAEEFYHNFAEGGLEWMRTLDTLLVETPLGEGDVRWMAYIRALLSVGYDGFLTVEREAKNGASDIANAVTFLQTLLSKI